MLLAALAVAPAPARAQPANPAEVEELIRQGNDLRRAGKDPMAVPVFQKAYDLERSARTAAQLGLVEAQMGYWVAAERHLSEALSFTRHPWLDRNRAVVDETLKRVQSYIGELGVTGSPSGAEVLVNEAKDEREFKLSSLARKGRKFTYEYDFGDGWVHDIVVEAVNRESN